MRGKVVTHSKILDPNGIYYWEIYDEDWNFLGLEEMTLRDAKEAAKSGYNVVLV